MRRTLLCASFTLAFMPWNTLAGANDLNLPAGTLLRCTLDEPNFSTQTAEEGDPVLCRATLQSQLGRGALPRSAYLVGRLGGSKDPGHFFGKGFLRLDFDHLSLADSDVPISAKVIAVRGYRVNRQGNILGHGHAKRDAVEWLFPPLWPWRILALPGRGPRPVLKGETPITLRLMSSVLVDMTDAPSGGLGRRSSTVVPESLPTARSASITEALVNGQRPTTVAGTVPLPVTDSDSAVTKAVTVSVADSDASTSPLTLFTLRNGTTRAAVDYWLDNGRLYYVLLDRSERSADLSEIDWAWTNRLNSERGVRMVLRSGR